MTDVLDREAVTAKAGTVTLGDYDEAVRLMSILANRGPSPRAGAEPVAVTHPVGKQWLLQACEHLYQKLDRSFRDHDRMNTEAQAISVIREVATHLGKAGQELLLAAEVLKNSGKGHQASRAFMAGKTAEKLAARYLGE